MGGGPSSQEKQQQQQSFNQLGQISQQALNTAQPFGQAGQQTLDTLTNYYKSLFGGDRSAVMSAIQPATSSATAAADAQKKQQATMGTARTGGTAAENQTIDDQVRAQIDNLIASVGPQAASSLEGIGNTQIQAMMSALGLGSGAASSAGSLIGSDINSQRQASSQLWGSLLGGAGQLGAAAIPYI